MVLKYSKQLTLLPGNKKKTRSNKSSSSSNSSRISTSYLQGLLESLKNQQHQDSTKTYYYKVWQKFNEFIIRLDHMPKSWEDRTSLYCGYLICEKKLQSSTVKSYISGIKSVLKNDGYMWDDEKVLLNVLTRSCKLKNDIVKTRLPIQVGLLDLILYDIRRRYETTQPYLEAMYITAYLFAYHGLLRVGELTQSPHTILAKNIHESRTSNKLLLVLYSSKTHGLDSLPQKIRIIGKSLLEVTNPSEDEIVTSYKSKHFKQSKFCPVEWGKRYISMRQPIIEDSEQFFIFSDGTNLQASHLRRLLRKILQSFQLDSNLYDTHSFRIGRATDLFKLGVSVDQIKQLGRWRSNAVYKYLRQ